MRSSDTLIKHSYVPIRSATKSAGQGRAFSWRGLFELGSICLVFYLWMLSQSALAEVRVDSHEGKVSLKTSESLIVPELRSQRQVLTSECAKFALEYDKFALEYAKLALEYVELRKYGRES